MIQDNLRTIQERIKSAALRANRSPGDIKLVAVSKRIDRERILEAIQCGQATFGENYVQESLEKIPLIIKESGAQAVSFHFIGRLQSNKARKAAELFDVIETVDNAKLARILDKHSSSLKKTLPAYLQVNIGREKQKSGVMPEDCKQLLQEISGLQHLSIIGLMTMPPFFDDPEDVRPYFRRLRLLSEELCKKGLLDKHSPPELSMGMSNDFEVAIEEGATVVRVGTAIFGQRQG